MAGNIVFISGGEIVQNNGNRFDAGDIHFYAAFIALVVISVIHTIAQVTEFHILDVETLLLITILVFFVYEIKEDRIIRKKHTIFENRFFDQLPRLEKLPDLSKLKFLEKYITKVEITPNTQDYYSMLIESVMKANNTIDLTYFTPIPPYLFSEEIVLEYWTTINKIIKDNKGIRVRRIVTIAKGQLVKWDFVKKNMEELKECANFHIAIQGMGISEDKPILNINVFDENEIYLFGPHSVSEYHKNIRIENRALAGGFLEYYNELWKDLPKLKEGKRISYEIVRQLNDRLKKENSNT